MNIRLIFTLLILSCCQKIHSQSEEQAFDDQETNLPEPDYSAPPILDSNNQQEDLARWDVGEASLPPDAEERVDEWESIPLPQPPLEDLMRDSEELETTGSEAKRELEEAMAAMAWLNTTTSSSSSSNDRAKDAIDDDGRRGHGGVIRLVGNVKVDEIVIFNTDDFDDEQSDFDDPTSTMA